MEVNRELTWEANPRTIGQTLLAAAMRWPNHDAATIDGARATYAELWREAVAWSRSLIAMGTNRGDHIGVLMPNCMDYVVLFHAITLIGGTPVLLNARYGADELKYAVFKADIRFLFIGGHAAPRVDFRPSLRRIYPELSDWDGSEALRLAAAPRLERIVELGERRTGAWPGEAAFRSLDAPVSAVRTAAAEVEGGDIGLIMFSSGTTSSPKACMLSHRVLSETGLALAERFRMTEADRVYDPTPLFHMSTMLPMAACRATGAAFIGTAHFDPGEALAAIRDERVTIAYTSFPAITSALLGHPDFTTTDVSSIRLMNNVGPPELLRRYAQAIPHALHVTAYGLTEAGGVPFFSELTDTPEQRETRAGRGFPGVETRIVDPITGEDMPPFTSGEIWLRGFCLFDGYYNDPERTAEAMTPGGWLRTGDLGDLDEDGRIRYLGRLKDMLKIGGENVAALEIESFLITHPAVHAVSVVGVPDDRLSEVAAAFVELRPEARATAEELALYCVGRIASFKIPRYIRFVTEWPMSATKIQKFRLLDGFVPDGKIDPRALREAVSQQ